MEEAKNQEEKAKIYLELEQLRKAQPEEIPGLIGVKYPYAADLALHAKMSVSELKEQGQFVDDAESAFLIKDVREKEDSEDIDNRSDSVAEEKARIQRASDRGTAYHRAGIPTTNWLSFRNFPFRSACFMRAAISEWKNFVKTPG